MPAVALRRRRRAAPVNELRDPALFEDGDWILVLYSAAGKRAIGLAELLEA